LLIKNTEKIFGLWSDRKDLDPDQYVREIKKGNRLDSSDTDVLVWLLRGREDIEIKFIKVTKEMEAIYI